jgi:predicted transcriptional regulator YheO
VEAATRAWLFDFLGAVAEGVVAVAGPSSEVVVHDFADLEHTAVAVVGNLTGRRPGAPIPDLGFLPEEIEGQPPDLLNYKISTDRGTFQSSTVYIRDPDGGVIGAVCINVDLSPLIQARNALNRAVSSAEVPSDLVVEDTFARNLDDLLEKSIAHFLRSIGAPRREDLSVTEKQRLVEYLEQRGLFKIRGAADELADILDVSRTTIYNYRAALNANDRRIDEDSRVGTGARDDS